MKRYVRSSYIYSDTDSIEAQDPSKIFEDYFTDCWEQSGLASKYPDLQLDFVSGGADLKRNYDTSYKGCRIEYAKYLHMPPWSIHLFDFEISYVQRYFPKTHERKFLCIYKYSYGVSHYLESYINSSKSTNSIKLIDPLECTKRNAKNPTVTLEDIYPKSWVIQQLRKYIPVCYDAIPEFIQDTQETNRAEKEKLEKQRRNYEDSLLNMDLEEKFNYHATSSTKKYEIVDELYDRGAESVLSETTVCRFTADGDYIAMLAFPLGSNLQGKHVDLDLLVEYYGEATLKAMFKKYTTTSKLRKHLEEYRYPDEYSIRNLVDFNTGNSILDV